MHIHSYVLSNGKENFRLDLNSRLSTDSEGIAACLGLQAEPKIELEIIMLELEKKLSANTILEIGPKPLVHVEEMPTE